MRPKLNVFANFLLWKETNTANHRSCIEAWWCQCHAAGKLVSVDGTMDGAKYRAILEDDLLKDAKDLNRSLASRVFTSINTLDLCLL